MAVQLPIYLDHQATTPVAPQVFEAIRPYFTEHFGNPASRSHFFGARADQAVEAARAQVAACLGCRPMEIVFTSGATEADNLAVKGAAYAYREKGTHLVTTQFEHHAVLDACKRLEREGFQVTYVRVGRDGIVDPADIVKAITPKTTLVSVMLVNNEIGTIQPLREIGAICKAKGVLLHTDAVQAVGKVSVSVDDLGADLLSLTAHKLYGPKGTGALYVRVSGPRVRLIPQLEGGGQEKGRRSGTLNVPGIVGLGQACELAGQVMAEETEHLTALRERLWQGLTMRLQGVHLNGHPTRRIPGNMNIAFEGVDAAALLMSLKELALSPGSACSSGSAEASHVLRAVGIGQLAHSSVRFGLGRRTTADEIDYVCERVAEEVARLRGCRAA